MRRILLVWLIALLTACGNDGDDPPPPVTLTAITATAAAASVAKGQTTQLTARGTYSDSTTAALTSGVSWTSSAPTIVSIDAATGLARGQAVGTANITATSGSVTGSVTITVTEAVLQSVAITPSPATAGIGMTLPFTATGTYSDNSTVNLTDAAAWTSSNPSVATIDSDTGVATGVTMGTTTIGAVVNSFNASSTLTITSPTWHPAAANPAPTYEHTATLISGGRVLIVGGRTASTVESAVQIYNGAQNSWSPASSMSVSRYAHTATLLADGRVLVVGGSNATAVVLASAEIYDPATNTWSSAGQLSVVRALHTATLLPSGRVLVTGGNSIPAGGPALISAELYDPATNTWSAAPDMANARLGHAAVALADGRVMVIGGFKPRTGGLLGPGPVTYASTELYDPVSNTWSPGPAMTVPRAHPTATVLSDGRVLAVGQIATYETEIYDPATNLWSSGGALVAPRNYHTATLLKDGKVLVAGDNITHRAEVFDPATNSWSRTTDAQYRYMHTATLLPNGAVFVTGGISGGSEPVASSELYW